MIDAVIGVELGLHASSTPFDREGVVEWQIAGSVLVESERLADLSAPESDVATLGDDPEFTRVTIFVMRGLTLNLLQVDARDALDEDSADAAEMMPLFSADGEFSEEVEDRLGGPVGAYSFVFLDRVWLLPAWRGFGLGRVLTDKAIGMVAEAPISLVGVHSHPYEDWDEEHPDPSPDAIARTDHVWESLGFVRVSGQLFVRDESVMHSFAAERANTLGLPGRVGVA